MRFLKRLRFYMFLISANLDGVYIETLHYTQ